MKQRTRAAFSLLELLIVISIISLLVQLALPAVQMARERSRIAQCSNNLRQLALASQTHEAAHKSLPTAGWGWAWVGDPNRGLGKNQPGSWAYQLLPYVEAQNVHDIGRGLQGQARHDALRQLASTPVALMYCPSRRLPKATPNAVRRNPGLKLDESSLFWFNSLRPEELARTDYVANMGSKWLHWGSGPVPSEAEKGAGFFEVAGFKGRKTVLSKADGIVFQRQPVQYRQITDGLSQTYFGGEKPLPYRFYLRGRSKTDDQSCWNGDAMDTTASTRWRPKQDRPLDQWIKQNAGKVPFGSAHIKQTNMAFCDGSVRQIQNEIDPKVHRAMGSRSDESIVGQRPAKK